ncbi:hypothetical protein ACHWQZ_G000321 [Mnemiopsis leidyi]
MLAFYFDVLVRYIPRPLFSLCEMDTDSLYMALAAETLDELVTSDLKSEWLVAKSHWFPRSDTAENVAYDKRTPGLFKIEWSGGGFVGLAAKTYFCFNPDNRQKEKCSTKGINKAAKISIDHFRSVLHTKQSVSSTNRGFILKDNNMLSYAMERSGLSYFYCKRKDLCTSMRYRVDDCLSISTLIGIKKKCAPVYQIREGIRKDMGDGTAINTRGYHANVVERDTLLPWQRSKTRQPVTIAT